MQIVERGYADLKPQQRIKCAHFLAYYGDEELAVKLTLLIESTGENSFKRVVSKLQLLDNEKPDTMRYHSLLGEAFEIGREYNTAAIITGVSKARREAGLSPHITSLSQNCINDFLSQFIVSPILEDAPASQGGDGTKVKKGRKVGYRTLFKLRRPESVNE